MKRTILLILTLVLILSGFAFVISCDKGDDVENDNPTYTLPDFEKMVSECKTLDEVIEYLTNEGYTAEYYFGLSFFNVVNAFKRDNGYDISINIALNPLISYDSSADPTELDKKLIELYPIDEYELAERKALEISGFEINYSVYSVLPIKTTYKNARSLCADYQSSSEIDAHLISDGYFKTAFSEAEIENFVIEYGLEFLQGYKLPSTASIYIKQEGEYLFSVVELNTFENEQDAQAFSSNIGYGLIPPEYTVNMANAIKTHGGKSPDEHNYTAGETEIYGENGCTEDFYTLATCACGATEQDLPENRIAVSAKDNHTLELVVEKRATCTLNGEGKKICTDCGYTEHMILPSNPDAHVYNHSIDVETEPTCTSDGYGTYHCSACHETVTGVIIGEHVYTRCNHNDGHFFSTAYTYCIRCAENEHGHVINPSSIDLVRTTVGNFSDGKTKVTINEGSYNYSFDALGSCIASAYTISLNHEISLDGDYTQKDEENNSSGNTIGGDGFVKIPIE